MSSYGRVRINVRYLKVAVSGHGRQGGCGNHANHAHSFFWRFTQYFWSFVVLNRPVPQTSPAPLPGSVTPLRAVASTQTVSDAVVAIFQAWQHAGIEFLILRNYETLPDSVGNDIDVLVRPSARDFAEKSMVEAAASRGFRRHNRAEFATLANYFCDEQSGAQLHVDLFTDLKWRSFDFLDCGRFLEQRIARGAFFIPHPAHEAATNLLATMIYNGSIKDKYKTSIQDGFRDHSVEAKALLKNTYGESLATFVVNAGARERWAELEEAARQLRRALVARQLLSRPFSVLTSILRDSRRLVLRWLRPPGLTIVLCGVDGSGKSTAAKALVEELSTTFAAQKGKQFHWKAPVFSGTRVAKREPTTQPHAAPPRNVPLSIVYLLFHWFEFFLGAFLRIRPATFKNGLVVIDRWYYDLFVDQRRYRLRVPLAVVGLGYVFLPRPDLVLLLDAPAEVLHQRKTEVSLAETQRQREAYLTLVRSLPQGRIIDAAKSPDDVAQEIKRTVLDYMAARMERRGR
jgi:thymidylate kinase